MYQEVVPASRSLAIVDKIERFLLSTPLLGGFGGSPVIDDGLLLAGMITEAPEDGPGGRTPNVYPALMVPGDAISSWQVKSWRSATQRPYRSSPPGVSHVTKVPLGAGALG